jgi:UDP-N-acetylglucosamine acyltransferase
MFWSRKNPELETRVDARFENAFIHPTAEIGADVEIGPFSYVGPECRVGDGCHLHNNVTLFANVALGERNEIYPGAVIGGLPQDKKYVGEDSRLVIGNRNVIRECVTISSGTKQGGGLTAIGDRNLIMASCHVAHDCILEDDIIVANNVLLGGHVRVEAHANFGGLAAVHHYVTVGRHAFVGGLTRVTQDVPPFMLVEGNPLRIWSINKVGLKRTGVPASTLAALKEVHRLLFRSKAARKGLFQEIEAQFGEVPEVRYLLDFVRATERGNQGRARQP